MEFINDSEEELLLHGMDYIARSMQTIICGKQRTLKHDLEFLEGAIELWMYEHHDYTGAIVVFPIWHLDSNMFKPFTSHKLAWLAHIFEALI